MKNTTATVEAPEGHRNSRLTRIKGWGVRCECGFDYQPGSRRLLMSEAFDILNEHRLEAAQKAR